MSQLSLLLKGHLHVFTRPLVMSIVNVTPDSFYAGSRIGNDTELLHTVETALKDGADIIDLGGCSTRPSSKSTTEDEELQRVSHAMEIIRKHWPDTPVSVDTFRSRIMRIAVRDFEADIINDISGGMIDHKTFETVAELNVPYVLMHMRGTPQTMQQLCNYDDILTDMLRYFAEKMEALRATGFDREIIIDPGFGFAKTCEQNYEIMRQLKTFRTLGAPLLVGISRKAMIYKPLEITPADALNGTTALNIVALMNGANILRVHDTRAAVETVKIFELLYAGNHSATL